MRNGLTDGGQPLAGLVQGSDGNFYGTTLVGGAISYGTVFKITPTGSLTSLYSFASKAGDGNNPEAGLVLGSDGSFYGTTSGGGAISCGAVFKITTDGNASGTTETTLHSFSGGADGSVPSAGLVQGSDGNFYGTTLLGGMSGQGAVFKITPSGSLTALYSFGTQAGDGTHPSTELVRGSDGNFYGTAFLGGATGFGTVFKITPSGVQSTLYSFKGLADGGKPYAGLVQGSDGSFYGTTQYGGVNGTGAVFKFTSAAGSTYALWNNLGQASLWKIPATGSVTSASFGPYSGWTPAELTSDTSGNAYILWTTTTGSASVWKLSSSLALTTSQSFGPYSGWSAKSLSVGPDGNIHVLWNHASDNAASIFNIVLGTSFTTRAYGPFAGWQAQQIALDYNNNTRVLWSNSAASQAALWNITSGGVQTSQSFGPFSGWQAQSLALAPGGQPRIVWKNTSTTQSSVLTVAPGGAYTSQAFGPFSGWAPVNLSVNADGDSCLMWNSTSNQLSLFDIGSTGSFTSSTYGPFSGWQAIAIAPGP